MDWCGRPGRDHSIGVATAGWGRSAPSPRVLPARGGGARSAATVVLPPVVCRRRGAGDRAPPPWRRRPSAADRRQEYRRWLRLPCLPLPFGDDATKEALQKAEAEPHTRGARLDDQAVRRRHVKPRPRDRERLWIKSHIGFVAASMAAVTSDGSRNLKRGSRAGTGSGSYGRRTPRQFLAKLRKASTTHARHKSAAVRPKTGHAVIEADLEMGKRPMDSRAAHLYPVQRSASAVKSGNLHGAPN